MKTIRVLSTALLLMLADGFAEIVHADNTGLEEAFHGQALGRGRFRSALIGLNRGFIVMTTGRQVGGLFVLDQIFRFDDGKTDRRTWRFRKTGPKTYAGTRQDVIGEAKVTVDADLIRMSYDIDMPQKSGGQLRLHFEDKVLRSSRGTIQNYAMVYALGMPVGSVETTLIRE